MTNAAHIAKGGQVIITKEETVMFNVPPGQDPYSSIGQYIQNHASAIEDIIATIEIDGVATNELFIVDVNADGCFAWKSDWYEGGENVVLMDFFPVSEAQRPSEQDEDVINRRAAIELLNRWSDGYEYIEIPTKDAFEAFMRLPSAQLEIIRCKYCRWGKESCGNIECFADTNVSPEYHGYEWFCPNGERRTDG